MLDLDRRSLLTAFGASALTTMLPAVAQAATGRTFFQRIGLPIGIQLYMLGPEAGRDVDATFAELARIGYREVELPNMLGRKPAQIAAAASRAGLTISSLHLPLLATAMPSGPLSMASEPARIAEELGALGARWAVAPIMLMPAGIRPQPGESFGVTLGRVIPAAGEDIWKQSAELLNKAGSALKPLGISVGYHNHNIEFAPIGKTTGWDILWRETQKDLVGFEVDIGWVATAGLDPVGFLERYKGRARLMHVKDVAADNKTSYQIEMSPAEVGSGTLDWTRILPAAYRAGVRHFLVEQEPPFAIPRMEAASRSHAFLSQLRT